MKNVVFTSIAFLVIQSPLLAGFVSLTLTELDHIDLGQPNNELSPDVPLNVGLNFNEGTADWVVDIFNNSPLYQNADGSRTSPGITGFGFEINPDTVSLVSWKLEAFNDASPQQKIIIGSKNKDEVQITGGKWVMTDPGNGNMKFDFVPETNGMSGGLYNPNHLGLSNVLFGPTPQLFTQATLSLTFSDKTSLFVDDNGQYHVGARLQNVGPMGKESATLHGGDPTDPAPIPAPEPSSILLLGLGAIGMIGYGYRRRKIAA